MYILAGFGIFSLMVLLLKLIMWCFKCDFDKNFVPIGESEIYTMRSSVVNMHAKEAIDQLDQMLDQVMHHIKLISYEAMCGRYKCNIRARNEKQVKIRVKCWK